MHRNTSKRVSRLTSRHIQDPSLRRRRADNDVQLFSDDDGQIIDIFSSSDEEHQKFRIISKGSRVSKSSSHLKNRGSSRTSGIRGENINHSTSINSSERVWNKIHSREISDEPRDQVIIPQTTSKRKCIIFLTPLFY